jgi:hypothetical protein
MSTIITRNSATSGSIPASLVQGELAINVTDGNLFYGSGSGNVVKQFGVTSSYALTASYYNETDPVFVAKSASLATTGSNIFRGNQTVTGSLFTTGSNTLIGFTTLTGSLNITGSTTQIGNNTLLGNTTLSGSIIISGSTITPTIQIYGNTTHDGYIRFNPVSTNLNPSISASYIYVSGSTNDLYFSQNGSGYTNTTRLRWLEGNLYTGLLHGGIITTQSSTVYQISSGSGIIVDLNASLSDDPYPVIQFLQWGNLSASIAPFTSSFQQAFVGIDSTNNIFAQGTPFSNGQFSDIINVGNVLFQNQSTINGVKTQPSVAYGFEQQQNTFNRAFGPLKLSGYTLAPSGSSTRSLIVASGTAYAPGSNYTIDPNDPSYTIDPGTNISKIFRYHQSGSTWVYDTNGGPGFATIDPTKYSNNGVLTNVGGGNWTIQRCFYFPNSVTKAIVVYYGNARYGTEAEARGNIDFESFVEAPNTSANAIYLGAIIINGTGVFTSPGDFTIYPGGLFRQVGGSGGGGSIVTQTLAGLSDVNISGPIDGQALVYNNTAAKWENKSSISASISGNASTATTASYALTASFASTVPASGVIGLNLSQIATASFTASVSPTQFTVTSASITEFTVTGTGVTIGNATTDTHTITGSLNISGSVTTTSLTSSTVLISGSGTNRLIVIGSGSAQPIFTVQGSQGELFSITDSLSGSLFSVNDISGLPILEVFSDNTTLMGSYLDPMLITTTKLVTTASGAFTLYSLPTSSYDTAFFEYSIKSGSNARAGSIMAIQSGTSVNFTETTTTDFGSTSGFGFTVQIAGANMILTGSATTSGWTIKTIVRGI